MHHQQNYLLAGLPAEDFALLKPALKEIAVSRGTVLLEPDAPIDRLYFPQSGMISLLVVTSDGSVIETGVIGREGALGLLAGFVQRRSFTRASVQIPGRFSTMPVAAFRDIASRSFAIRDMIARATESSWEQAQQIAACNAVHDASARLCRWLLRCADRAGSDTLAVTQDFLGQMLGVRRTTVTLLAQEMQERGIIKYTRGNLTILNRELLEASACECYGVLEHKNLASKFGISSRMPITLRASPYVESHAAGNGAGLPRSELLDVLVQAAIEQSGGKARAAFYAADGSEKRLYHITGMPEAYARLVNGFPISPESLACGLAAATRQPVITPDVVDEPRWKPWVKMARQFDYRACWSFPVETMAGKLVGTFAMYYAEPMKPTPHQLDFASTMARVAAKVMAEHQGWLARMENGGLRADID